MGRIFDGNRIDKRHAERIEVLAHIHRERDSIHVFDRQRPEKQRVQYTEDSGVRSDAKRQTDNDHGAVDLIANQLPQREANAVTNTAHLKLHDRQLGDAGFNVYKRDSHTSGFIARPDTINHPDSIQINRIPNRIHRNTVFIEHTIRTSNTRFERRTSDDSIAFNIRIQPKPAYSKNQNPDHHFLAVPKGRVPKGRLTKAHRLIGGNPDPNSYDQTSLRDVESVSPSRSLNTELILINAGPDKSE